MALCAFMGDEVSAAAFRLAGVDVYRPQPDESAALFRRLRGEVRLILLTAEVAATLPPELLLNAQLQEAPLVMVIPDVRNRVPAPDLAVAVRRQLGMAE